MSNKLEWDGDRFEWVGERCKPAIEAEVSSSSYDAPWIEFGNIEPKELCKRWNYHEQLVEALRNMVKPHGGLQTDIVAALDILEELGELP